MKTQNNKEFERTARQNQNRFLSKKSAWENHEPLTPSDLADRKFWKEEINFMILEGRAYRDNLGGVVFGEKPKKPSLIERILYPFGR